jgi:PncC family amidohydrolase
VLPEDLVQQAEKIIQLYQARDLTIATAESCTGGLIATALTAIPGSSAVFERGYVTYSNESKTDALGVPASLIETYGAVSEEVAAHMARGTRAQARTDVAVSVTGIAGPDGGTKEKSVGLVYVGISSASHQEARRFQFSGNRDDIRKQAAIKALSWLLALGKEL